MAYCGCQQTIHAVTPVRAGLRLVLVVWTRRPDVHVPEQQQHVCYFRPGSGLSIWLTSADLQSYPKRRRREEDIGLADHGDEQSDGVGCATATLVRKAAGFASASGPPLEWTLAN